MAAVPPADLCKCLVPKGSAKTPSTCVKRHFARISPCIQTRVISRPEIILWPEVGSSEIVPTHFVSITGNPTGNCCNQALALIERTAPTSDNASCSQETRRTAHWPGWLTALLTAQSSVNFVRGEGFRDKITDPPPDVIVLWMSRVVKCFEEVQKNWSSLRSPRADNFAVLLHKSAGTILLQAKLLREEARAASRPRNRTRTITSPPQSRSIPPASFGSHLRSCSQL